MNGTTNKNIDVQIVSATNFSATKAAALLIFTKSTRLNMGSSKLYEIEQKCASDNEWMMKELDYMSKTIRSSWEFLDITFSISNVSRACAQQITRTRFTPIDGDLFGSYAMQSQRVTDMSKATWHNPIIDNGVDNDLQADHFDTVMLQQMHEYKVMMTGCEDLDDEPGFDPFKAEDARGVLPMNLHCNLVAKYNLRMLVEMLQARESYRAQGEFNQLARLMRQQLIEMWPWVELFLRPRDELAKAAVDDLRESIRRNCQDVVPEKSLHEIQIYLAKVDDLLQGKR